MPQMAPINWLFLFIIFSFSFMLFNLMNYYIYTPMMPKSSNKKKEIKMYYWKW